jgi:hypothetical protein
MSLEVRGIFNWIVSYGTPLLIQDAQADFRLDAPQMRSLGFRPLIAIPLRSSNIMMAILSVVNKTRFFDTFFKSRPNGEGAGLDSISFMVV